MTAPIKLVSNSAATSAAKKALSSIRNGPIKANVGTSAKTAAKSVQRQRNNGQEAQGSMKQHKVDPAVKKIRPQTAQHNRPSSPGIHGKVADAPYKSYANSLKSIIVTII